MERDESQNKEKNQNYSSINREIEAVDNSMLEPYFGSDGKMAFVFNKTKRIVSAAFLISNFLPDDDVLKKSIRQIAIRMLRSCACIKDASTAENTYERDAIELASLLDVAYVAGFVSEMNAHILRDEIEKTLSMYREAARSSGGSTSLSRAFFGGEWKERSEYLPTPAVENTLERKSPAPPIQNEENNGVNEGVAFENGGHSDRESKLKEFGPVAIKRNRRQSLIINYLKRKKTAMVKDFTSIITDCSEKTIQRELSLLVEDGVLKKEGERRWTKYSLAA